MMTHEQHVKKAQLELEEEFPELKNLPTGTSPVKKRKIKWGKMVVYVVAVLLCSLYVWWCVGQVTGHAFRDRYGMYADTKDWHYRYVCPGCYYTTAEKVILCPKCAAVFRTEQVEEKDGSVWPRLRMRLMHASHGWGFIVFWDNKEMEYFDLVEELRREQLARSIR